MANGPGGKSAGRVSIRVVPDSTRFNADLKKSLDRIEKSTVLNIPLAIETRQAELDLRKFLKKWNGQDLNLDVDAATAGAAAHLKEFTRRRSLDVDVDISKTSLAKAATLLAGLSGARVGGDLVKNITKQLGGLDRSLPKIAAMVLAIGSIGAVALSSVGGVATLAVSLGALSGLAAPLAGIFGAAATGLTILIVALSDTSNQLSSLSSVWTKLRSIIVDNFWAKAKKPIIDFVRSTLPQLKTGLASSSSALGSWTASLAAGFQKAFGGGVLSGMLAKLTESINIAATGTGGFASAIARLGSFGASYLPRLAQAFADMANQFDAWLAKVASDGRLSGWVENGIDVVKELGSTLGAVVSIINGVASAALAAGGGGLGTLVAVLQTIADVVNSPAFQSTLTTLFQGASAGVSGLLTALTPIGALLAGLAPTLATLLSSIGVTVGTVIGQIASALSDPAIGAGLLALFQGIRDGLTAIGPALPAVASALAVVGQFAGALAAQLGPVLGAALTALAPIVTTVLDALQPLIPVLGGILLQAISAVTPLIDALVPVFASLVPVISAILSAIAPLIGAVLPVLTSLVQLITPIIEDLAGVFMQIADAVTPIIQAILPPLAALLAALMPIISALIQPLLAILQPFLDLIAPLLALIGPILTPLIQLLTAVAGIVVQALVPAMDALSQIFGGVASAIAAVLLPVVKQITTVLGGLITFITGVFTGNWKQAWQGIVQIFTGIWNGIVDVGKGALNGLIDIINGLIGGVNDVTGAVGIPKIPKIPHLASGADIEGSLHGTAVIVGDGGKKETVTDFGKTNALIQAAASLAQRALSTGAGASVTNEYQIYEQPGEDPRVLARTLAREQALALAGLG